ncbi:hypothetical protein L6Q21_02060 [Sandaracinobacter sp. RS1-74]|uniref:hypothetical protein n=1 Tax=Sandaracinobacteroides sayramensis TaxID=2913411 RepID=UPI001EDAAC04|nr:hypothetical protein [Sandaracinobacteroides sayramensis]MCG2839765.1 hypothetical protein [Sandaracinobacteroides sayramensis]
MGILSAAVEANGWVLAVRGDWAATAGAWSHGGDDRVEGRFLLNGVEQFALDPDGAARVRLSVVRQGFAREGGRAVPSVGDSELLVAVKALRRPWPNQTQLDETDHGDGTRTLRLALSGRVYAGDVVTGARFAAGWKPGGGEALVGAVANGSTRALPVAISRWAQPSFALVRGTTRMDVDVIVAAHHPRHFGTSLHQALAAMKITATDGVLAKEFWFARDRVSAQHGDNLLCWGGEIDLSGLSPGPVTLHREEFPWIGASRSTGAGHSTDATDGLPTAWASPLMVCYDPDGTLYPNGHVYVDAASGSTDAAAVTVGGSLAEAKAGRRAADISTAFQALYLRNYALPERNGWAADTQRAADWTTVTLAPGVHGWGETAVTSGLACNEGRIRIEGDPSDSDPRANCIWRSGGTSPTKRAGRFWLRNLTVEAGEASLGGALWHFENVELRGKPGFEASTTPPVSASSPTGYARMSATRMRWWRYGVGPEGSSLRFLLMRNCEHSRSASAVVHISSSKCADPLFPTRDTGSAPAFATWGLSTLTNSDAMLWGCRAMDWAGRFVNVQGSRDSGAGVTGDPVNHLRFAMVNCLCERSRGVSSTRIWSMGESSPEQLQDSVIEGNTLQGNGWNGCYNGGALGAPYTDLAHIGNSLRNNLFGRHAKKGDIFNRDGSLTAEWEYLYGVGFAGNVHANSNVTESSNFQFAWFGLGAAVDTSYAGYGSNAFLRFVSDMSDRGPRAPVGPGNGDYRPDAGSPARGRGRAASTAVDIDNLPRRGIFTAGALEAVPLPPAQLLPASAALAHQGEAARLSLRVGLRPQAAAHGVSDTTAWLTARGAGWPLPAGRMLRVDGEGRTARIVRD